MWEYDPNKRMPSKEGDVQLHSIKDELTGKEKELLELCGRDSRSDLTGKIKELIQFGINLNAKDNNGMNALHLLCRYYSNPKLTDAIQLVVKSGIDVNARDNDGMNAIHYLCQYQSSQNLIDAIQILIQLGIDANAKSNDGSNVLHYLCRDNSNPNLLDAFEILTEYGVDAKAKDKDGWNANYYLYNNDKKVMKIWFDRENPIGEGSFGMVCKGKFGGREVAVKRVEMRHVDKIEEEAMLKLDHPNIVKLLHCEKDQDFMYYALELCNASLDQVFLNSDDPKKYKGPMPRQIEVFHQLATGLAYIHSKNLIHRDIKPNNVLIKRSPGQDEKTIIKLADFGLAKKVTERGSYSWTGREGTRNWYAPEVLHLFLNKNKKKEDEEAEKKRGTVKSDVFVLGLVFGYLFLEGEHLFGSSEKENEIHDNIIGGRAVNMKNIDAELRKYYEDDLLNKMLQHDSVKRISSKEVVEQLESITEKLAEKEEEFLLLCARGSLSDLKGRANDFIRIGIDVNAKGYMEMNALHHLCQFMSSLNLIDAIQLLIPLGIDVNAKDNDGMSALHYLCKFNSNPNLIDAVQLLIPLGIHVNAKDRRGMNALHHLCKSNSSPNLIDAIQLLIQKGIDVNAKGEWGKNALHYLCEFNSSPNLIDAIQLLIQLGIDVNAKNISEKNALHYLCEFNSSPNLIDAMKLLIQLGIDVNAKGDRGKNALHYLCEFNSSPNLINAIQLLIQLGIDVNAKDNDGRNARSYLRYNDKISNKDEILQLLDAALVV
ncbi:calcium-dependent protein kinase 2-like [Daphnia carinata]|uniref:calcium-dependent protein kinase 2-like n=1 Tax=Daphnia carinata TaxID=120202 RepID=UPI00257D1BFC|nr:calcium-dependent protein kinase 2-like [Daphnia carinata]